ncbi:DNA-3-methyladenine glycosylase family protein [Aurantibacillus circumpalustris]|uniref:DNA-3-methyladenine glycosylase family protein n=1 Tax=Aurantibacillus circumpalustris TaxID=3036359 RepID=UPI00295BF039|nr:DNA-3-methyladenine glycosylase [Aurantibacillus circumpalustris]
MTKHHELLTHLKKDKILKKVIQTVGEIKTEKNLDLYFSLMRSIVSQQLSVKAAATIWGRFLDLFKDRYPDAKILLKINDDKLRAVGLSYQKAGYLKNIARFSLDKTLEYKLLKSKTDDELIDYLIEIKGVGRWTVEMLLMFSLKRDDVFPVDDLGIQNGIKILYNLNSENKKQLYSQMLEIAENWRPYRSIACMYIWRHKDSK